MIRLMKKTNRFVWDEACENTFNGIKHFVLSPPIQHKPVKDQPLLIYLVVSDGAISTTLV